MSEKENDPTGDEVKDVEIVTITATPETGEATEKKSVFHTPTLLKLVSELPDDCTVEIKINDPDKTELRSLLKGTKAEAVSTLERSIVPPEMIATELRKYIQFLIDHSSLRAAGVHAVYVDDNDKNCGFGFAATSSFCTSDQAVSFVNCGDANIDEFVSKAGITVPGRGIKETGKQIVTPTPDEVEKLG